MAVMGNDMWHSGDLNPINFAVNRPVGASALRAMKGGGRQVSDSMIGAPLATFSTEPPAGPIEESLRSPQRNMNLGFTNMFPKGSEKVVGVIAGFVAGGALYRVFRKPIRKFLRID